MKWSKLRIFLKTVRKYRYELMYADDAYKKDHLSMPGNANSGVGIPLPIS